MNEKPHGFGNILSKLGELGEEALSGINYKEKFGLVSEQFEALFEYSGVGMIVIGPDMSILRANKTASEISGYPLDILIDGRTWADFFDLPEEVSKILAIRKSRLETDTPAQSLQYECSFTHANGSHRHLLVNVTQIPGEENIISSFSDITRLYDAHTLLQLSESRFKETAELLPVIICEFNDAMEFTYVNQKGYDIFGYTQAEVVQDHKVKLVDFFLEEDIPRLQETVRKRWTENYTEPSEYVMKTALGVQRQFLLISSLIGGNEKPTGLRSCLVDITDFRKVETQLVERERRLRAMYDSSPIGITVLDKEGIPLEMNQAFCTLFGVCEKDLSRLPSLFPALGLKRESISSSKKEVICGFRMIAMDDITSYETVVAENLYYSWHITPLSEQGDSSFLCQVIDITERQTVEMKRLKKAESLVEGLKRELSEKTTRHGLESKSPQLQVEFEKLPTIANTTATLLVTGESGTGKELLAQTVHKMSDRSSKPFVAINCGALPDALLESELFGHKAGAFTDARSDRKGKFLSADGGTLFLDEIGEIAPPMQVKLLRVLQERNFQPLGSDKTVHVDVRIIVATNKDLAVMVQEGAFREDLYYRIKVLNFLLPPLRQRRLDIPSLCDQFIAQYNRQYNKKITGLSVEALDLLLGFSFPGNIRELQNILEHASIFCSGSLIEAEHLPEEVRRLSISGGGSLVAFDDILSLDDLTGRYLLYVIKQHGGNKTKTAQALGMHKATLFRKLKRLGLTEEGEEA